MTSDGSVSQWIGLLKEGDRAAAQPLWEAYFQRLVALARAQLRNAPRRARDEEDIALSAFNSFCQRVEQGRFPQLEDRNDLWQVLYVITVRKSVDFLRHENRQARGRGRVLSLSDLSRSDLDQILDPEPTPALAAQLADECRRLLDGLGDATLRAVALGRMRGDTNAEIAKQLDCVEQTIERKLRRIRSLWAREVE